MTRPGRSIVASAGAVGGIRVILSTTMIRRRSVPRTAEEVQVLMTDGLMSPARAAITGLVASAERYAATIVRLPEHRLNQRMTGINDEWSPRDTTAHLIGWNARLEAAIEGLVVGRAPEYLRDRANDFASVNADAVRRHSADSKMALMMGLHASLSDLKAALEATSEDVWTVEIPAPGGTVTLLSQVQAITEDYDYHADQIARWAEGSTTNER